MKCKDIGAMLSDYVDGELNDEIRCEVTEHLATCSSCAGEYRQLDKSLRLLKRLKKKKAPHDFLGF